MNIQIMIGGIRFRVDSDCEITVEKSLTPFLCVDEEDCDVVVKIICTREKVEKPEAEKYGEDLLLEYYLQKDQFWCLAKGSRGEYISKTVCDGSLKYLNCYLYWKHMESMNTLGSLLRLVPTCIILQRKGALFFHASQIEVSGKGILFTAPSGTGKTTQAKLWKKYRDAKVICNDRTLIRKEKTYGYPVDGSEPVRSGKILPLGAIVLLEQGEKNFVRKLTPKEALLKLFAQLLLIAWDSEGKLTIIEQLTELLGKYPVYLLCCTPEESAVQCLEEQLKIDGVI